MWDHRSELTTERGTVVKREEATSDVSYAVGAQQGDGEESGLLTEKQCEHRHCSEQGVVLRGTR